MSKKTSPIEGESIFTDGPIRTRFIALWTRCPVAAAERAKDVFDCLVNLYGEPHRHYHTLEHIRRCLNKFDLATTFMDDPDAVEMAIWFHDAIYDLSADNNNELRSTELFRQQTGENAETNFVQKVCDLIMATMHNDCAKNQDACFIVDIDLCSFGQQREYFNQDSQRIRAEYIDVDDDKYYQKQLEFIRILQNKPFFFCTQFFRERYERAAQNNINNLLEELQSRGYS